MLADSTEGLFSGLSSGVMRPLWTLLAIFLAFLICILPIGLDDFFVVEWLVCSLGGIATWGCHGIIGLLIGIVVTGITMIAGTMFMLDQKAKRTWFITFSGATLFYAPAAYDATEFRWIISLALYLLVSGCYWFLPRFMARTE